MYKQLMETSIAWVIKSNIFATCPFSLKILTKIELSGCTHDAGAALLPWPRQHDGVPVLPQIFFYRVAVPSTCVCLHFTQAWEENLDCREVLYQCQETTYVLQRFHELLRNNLEKTDKNHFRRIRIPISASSLLGCILLQFTGITAVVFLLGPAWK